MISAASNQRREWPAQLAKAQFIWPNQVSSRSKRANATIITGGWLMKCPPPQNPTCSPRPARPHPAGSSLSSRLLPPWRRRGPRASKTAECRATTSSHTPECRFRHCVCKERGLTLPQIYECELRQPSTTPRFLFRPLSPNQSFHNPFDRQWRISTSNTTARTESLPPTRRRAWSHPPPYYNSSTGRHPYKHYDVGANTVRSSGGAGTGGESVYGSVTARDAWSRT